MTYRHPHHPRLRVFSLFDAPKRKKGGGKFRDFLSAIGRSARPFLKGAENSLKGFISQKLGNNIGREAVKIGSELIGDLAEKKAQQFENYGKKRLNDIKGKLFGGFSSEPLNGDPDSLLPADISKHLYARNKKSLIKLLGKRKKRKKKRKTVGGKKKKKKRVGGGNNRKKLKKGGQRRRRRRRRTANPSKTKGGRRKKRRIIKKTVCRKAGQYSGKGGRKSRRRRRSTTKNKQTSIFD